MVPPLSGFIGQTAYKAFCWVPCTVTLLHHGTLTAQSFLNASTKLQSVLKSIINTLARRRASIFANPNRRRLPVRLGILVASQNTARDQPFG